VSSENEGKARPALHLDKSVLSVTVVCSLVGMALWLGFWTRDREASREAGMLAKLSEVQAVFAQRQAVLADDTNRALADIRVLIERTRSEILAAVAASGERVALLERQTNELRAAALTTEWAFSLKSRNPTIDVPANGK
jgi:inorganic triphosphatase YgiF